MPTRYIHLPPVPVTDRFCANTCPGRRTNSHMEIRCDGLGSYEALEQIREGILRCPTCLAAERDVEDPWQVIERQRTESKYLRTEVARQAGLIEQLTAQVEHLQRQLASDDPLPRKSGCRCQLEEGDSPCPVHGDDDEPVQQPNDEQPRGHWCQALRRKQGRAC